MRLPRIALSLAVLLAAGTAAQALELREAPSVAVEVSNGRLPPVRERVPSEPLIVAMDGQTLQPGKPGGELRMLIGRARDVRLIAMYGYARLVGYDRDLNIQPDLAKAIEVEDEKVFTIHLRKGHRWSNGDPFTSEDFRYWWEDVANNKDLSPAGPPVDLMVDGELPKVEFIDATTIRYTWTKRNPLFLARLAGAAPLYPYRPSAYLKQYHGKYADREKLQGLITRARMRGWAQLHNRLDNLLEMDNPEVPTLEPWRVVTRSPAIRFLAERNPYFHRVDSQGMQLPYLDRVVLNTSDGKLIPAKAAAGEVDLQARNIAFNNFTFLKENEKRSGYQTLLWRTAKGSQVALYPNLNTSDPVWQKLLRDRRFRRALSMGVDREGINQSLFFGLGIEGNNTMLPGTPLFRDEYLNAWTKYDLKAANRLLDEIGLKQGPDRLRLLPDGRPMEIIIETAGEDSEQSDVLELVTESWAKLGIRLLVKPSQREVMRNRVYSGEAMMTVWSGFDNGVATASMSPWELAPTNQAHPPMWPKWGQYFETKGASGEAPDMPAAVELLDLYRQWIEAGDTTKRAAIWHRMLKIHAEEQFSIGIVSGVYQPVVKTLALRNVPEEGLYNFDPGSFFGMYRPDTFWFDR